MTSRLRLTTSKLESVHEVKITTGDVKTRIVEGNKRLSLIKKTKTPTTTKTKNNLSGSLAKQKINRVHNYHLVLSSIYDGLILELKNLSIELLRFVQNAF